MTESSRRTQIVRVMLVVVVIAVLALSGRTLATHLSELTERIEAMGPAGVGAFVIGFAVAGALFVPASILTIISGALFGLAAGTAYAFMGATLGACLAFLLARYVVRPAVERQLARRPRLAAINEGVGVHGWKIVALLRLSPIIPFNMINLAMGVTRIRFVDFAGACIAMLPVTTLFVYYGTVAGSVAAAVHGRIKHGNEYYVLLGLGLVATIAVTAVVTRLAQKELGKKNL